MNEGSSPGAIEKNARIAFVTPVTPAFTGNGLAMRAASLIEALAKRGTVDLLVLPSLEPAGIFVDREVESLCASCEVVTRAQKRTERKNIATGIFERIFSRPENPEDASERAWSEKLRRKIVSLRPNLIFVYRLSTLAQVSQSILTCAPLWLDLDELDSAALRREAAVAKADGQETKSAELQVRVRTMAGLEQELLPLPRWLSVSSPVERHRVPAEFFSKTNVLPNVVRSRPVLAERVATTGPYRLLFVGSFGHGPNVDAVAYFQREILPRIKYLLSSPVEFHVVGPDPRQVLQPFRDLEGVRILGRLDDLTSAYQSADLIVVPLRSGAGTRIKILEAFSYGRCVVSTPCGAEGLEVSSGQELIIADGADAFATACVDLLLNGERRRALARGAADWLSRRHLPVHLQEALAAAWRDPMPKPL